MSSMDRSLLDELTCSVCLGLYNEPLLLPCGHSFCGQCLDKIWKAPPEEETEGGSKQDNLKPPTSDDAANSNPTSDKANPDSRDKLKCPECRKTIPLGEQGIDSLPKNFALSSVVERYRADEGQSGECTFCDGERPVAKCCLQCKQVYCMSCLEELHPMRARYVHHTIVDATANEAVVLMSSQEILCSKHNEKLIIFCYDCVTPVCHLFDRFDGHDRHKVHDIKTAYDDIVVS
jgi:hypothetical protein